jgi:hemoglobin-like flavoprotein
MRNFLTTTIVTIALTVAAPAFAAGSGYSTEATDIGTLMDNPETKAVLEKHIPLVIANEQFQAARPMTFRAIQSFAGDALSDEVLAKIDADLAKIAVK